jgi:hypothetical protein
MSKREKVRKRETEREREKKRKERRKEGRKEGRKEDPYGHFCYFRLVGQDPIFNYCSLGMPWNMTYLLAPRLMRRMTPKSSHWQSF